MRFELLKLLYVKLIVLLSIILIVILALTPQQKTKEEPQMASHITIKKPTPTTPLISDTAAFTFYNQWKQTYVIKDISTHALRVYRPDTYKDTVSAAIATGMLAAVSMHDKQTFDGLWSYAKQHMNNNGLMVWNVSANGKNLDTMSATDADEDMAYALITADTKWGGYKQDTQSLLSNIMSYDVEQNTYILKPGDTWGGSDVLSPSYISPAYYDAFAEFTRDLSWIKVKNVNQQIISKIINNTPAGKTGLIPDWTTVSGTEVAIYNDKNYIFGYKSINAAWRLALAAMRENDSQAIKELETLSDFFKTTGANSIVDGYSVDGVDMGAKHYQAFVDAAVIASMYSKDKTYKKQMFDILGTSSIQNSFYADSYRLITLLILSNQFSQV